MPKFILIDPFNSRQGDDDAATNFETLASLENEVRKRANRFDPTDYDFENWQEELEAYEVASVIPLTIERSTTVKVGVPTEIPGPMAGETVADYAKRITALAAG